MLIKGNEGNNYLLPFSVNSCYALNKMKGKTEIPIILPNTKNPACHCPSLLAYFFFYYFEQNNKMLEFTLQKQRR